MVQEGCVCNVSSRDIFCNARTKAYPDGTEQVLVCDRPIFGGAGWEDRRPSHVKATRKPRGQDALAGAEWAFPGRSLGAHRTRQAVWADVKRAAKAFRLPQNVAPHSFRKVFAVELMGRYGDIGKVQRALNHGSAATTPIYAMADRLLEARKGHRGHSAA